MAEALTCTQCGGMLDENYRCPFCGAMYEKPQEQTTTYNVNIVNNYGSPTTTASAPNLPPPTAPPTNEAPPIDEEPQEEPTGGSAVQQESELDDKETKFIKDNSMQLIFLLAVAIGGVCFGVWLKHDWMIVVGVISGALFAALSKPLGGKKK